MFSRHRADKLIFSLIAVGLISAVSYRPKYRLRAEMPVEFFSEAGVSKAARAGVSVNETVAKAYWESAETEIQWKFPHGRVLPLRPPPEFRVQLQALGRPALEEAVRQQYWSRLRLVWNSPDTWKTEYGWNWTWIGDPLTSTSEWIRDTSERIFSLPK
ncbi:MAG: hypothetical protein JOZ14_04295 [Acidobacteria bacterium]|nr:hypothetical protein [Acidobacteriota bacterium]